MLPYNKHSNREGHYNGPPRETLKATGKGWDEMKQNLKDVR